MRVLLSNTRRACSSKGCKGSWSISVIRPSAGCMTVKGPTTALASGSHWHYVRGTPEGPAWLTLKSSGCNGPFPDPLGMGNRL